MTPRKRPKHKVENTRYGFKYGPAEVSRFFSNDNGVDICIHSTNSVISVFVHHDGTITVHDNYHLWIPVARRRADSILAQEARKDARNKRRRIARAKAKQQADAHTDER